MPLRGSYISGGMSANTRQGIIALKGPYVRMIVYNILALLLY